MTDRLMRDDGTVLAVARRAGVGAGPTILFLPGYRSDMTGDKATMLDVWAGATGRAMLRFDYAGCGASEGVFEDQTLADWRDDALLAIDRLTDGPVVLVGSSMGGWLALLVALARSERVSALVGIAAAPDFTEWGYDAARRTVLRRDGRIEDPSPYGTPMVTTLDFWESGQANRLLDAEIGFEGPVRLLHGQADATVPWELATRIAARLRSADVQTILVKDGDHRLSRPQDLALLRATVAGLVESL